MSANQPILSVKEAALSRRSIRKYKQQPVPKALLEEVLDVSLKAPSANNLQPWRIVVVENPELKAKLQEAAFNQGQVTSAPAVLVLYSDLKEGLEKAEEVLHPLFPEDQKAVRANNFRKTWAERSDQERETWGAGQSYILLGYLMLTARAYGLDTSPMLGFNPAKVKELLGLPEYSQVAALLPIGYADEEGFPHHRHRVDRVVTWR